MISCLVHTYNEEKNLPQCLSSLKFADEIIVVDMASTDKTLEIAKLYGAEIYSFPSSGFVEPARNYGIQKAKGDWILIVDSDETISKSLAVEIKKQISEKTQSADYFRIPRKNIIFNKWIQYSGWWPDYQIRLFKKGHVEWNEKIHGIPQTRGIGSNFPPHESHAIIHNNYRYVSQYLERMNRYTAIQAKEIYAKNSKIKVSEFIFKPLNEFVSRFFTLEGYKDGLHGLSLSLLQAFSELVVILKIWELGGFKKEHITLEQIKAEGKKANRIGNFWMANELLKNQKGMISSLFLKFQRKINS